MKGLIPRIVESVFDSVDRADPETEFTIQVSYIEIYLEKIRDLLDRKYLYLNAFVLLSVISSSYATELKDQRRQTQRKGVYISKVQQKNMLHQQKKCLY